MPSYLDPPAAVLDVVREACSALPDAYEERAWAGVRWMIRKRNFVHVITIDREPDPVTVMTFRSSGLELDALLASGHPFFRAGWGTNVIGMVLEERSLDLDEIRELLTESYCLLAPKKLVAQLDLPPPVD